MTTPTAPADDALPAELAAALERMDVLLDPALDLLTAGPDSATAKGSRDDMRTIRNAIAARASPSRAAVQSLDREALVELIAQHLSGTYHCGRVWAAWSVGTMSEDDFSDVGESDTPGEIADAIMAKFAAPGTAPAPVVQPVAAYGLGDFFRDAKRTGLTADSFAAALAARPEFADCLQPVPAAVDVGAAAPKGGQDEFDAWRQS